MAGYIELNMDDIVERWSTHMFNASEDSHDVDASNFDHEIDYSRVKFMYAEPDYQTFVDQGKPKSEIIYETIFRNNTEHEQKFSLKTIRSTTSTAKLDITRAIVADGKTKLNISPLPEQVSGKSGFQNEMSIQNIGQEELKEKLSWEIDNHVTVASGSSVKAEVIVNEKSYQAKYSVKTEIVGNVHVDVVDPDDNNSLVRSHDGDIVRLLKYYNKNTRRIEGISFQNHAASFHSEGICTFRYGVNQNVNLTTLNTHSPRR